MRRALCPISIELQPAPLGAPQRSFGTAEMPPREEMGLRHVIPLPIRLVALLTRKKVTTGSSLFLAGVFIAEESATDCAGGLCHVTLSR